MVKTATPAKRVGMYYRVSGKEQLQGYSLDAQVRAIEAWCEQQGWKVVARYPEPARSARTDAVTKRPAFQDLLADAEAGRFDVVVVHKLDRFARNLRVLLESVERLEQANVGFVSVSENVDFSTPMGRMVLSTMGGLAQFYSDNLASKTRKGKAERKAQGLHNGLLPFGTTKGPGGLPVLDREARWCDVATRREVVPAEGLLLAFALAASGKTDRLVVRALNEAGYRTSGNRGQNPFTRDTIREILTNRFYVGDLPDGAGGWVNGKHGALIDPDLFVRAQRAREANTTRPLRVAGDASPWALSGVATCGTCGKSLRAYGRSGGRRRVQYAGRAEGNGCDEPTFFADIVEDQMGALLARFAVPESDQAVLLHAWRRSQSRSVDVAAERLRIRRKLERLKDLYLEGDLDQATWRTQRATLQEELATLPPEGDPDHEAGTRLAAFLRNVASAWQVATPEERNRLARQLFVEAIVENRTAVALVPRPDLRPFFETLACQVPDEMTRWRKRRGSVSRVHSPARRDPLRPDPGASPMRPLGPGRLPATPCPQALPRAA